MLRAVGVPDREDGVVVEVAGTVYVPVHAPVLPVHVHIDRRVDHRVVERRVEHRLLAVRSLAVDDRQLAFPGVAGLLAQCLERLSAGLCPQVLQGSLGRDCRERHLHRQFVARRRLFVEVEVSHHAAPRDVGEVVVAVEFPPESHVVLLLPVAVAVAAHGFRERDGKVGVVRAGPSVGDAVARQQRVVLHAQRRPQHLPVVVVDAVQQVHDDALSLTLRVCVAVDARARRGCQLRPDAVAQCHLVVARARLLRVVSEALPVAPVGILFRARVQQQRAHLRHDQDVAQVRVARAAQVRMAESHDGVVRMLVSGTIVIHLAHILPVDIVGDGVRLRTELYDAEGCAGAGKRVSHALRADHRVHIVCLVACHRGVSGHCSQCRDDEDETASFHFCVLK